MSRANTQGLALGLLGVTIFAMTLPMTRLAVGDAAQPQLSGVFLALGRAVVAAGFSATYLWLTRAPWPTPLQWRALGVTAAGVVLGFPLLTSLAMRQVEAVHASVMVGMLPLATACVGALLQRQRPSAAFWVCAVTGSALVAVFSGWRSGAPGLTPAPADALLLGATACAAVGYGFGARLSREMRAEQVICWALLLALPITLPGAWWAWPLQPIQASAWWGFGYVSVFSMWLGFFAWYRALAVGGTVRVSQVQLVQPFLSMLFAVPLLGERLDATTVAFGVAVMATVFLGRKAPVHAP